MALLYHFLVLGAIGLDGDERYRMLLICRYFPFAKHETDIDKIRAFRESQIQKDSLAWK